MVTRTAIPAVVAIALLAAPPLATAKTTIALDFVDAPTGDPEGNAARYRRMQDVARIEHAAALTGTQRLQLVERAQLNAILKEIKASWTPDMNPQSRKQIGKLLSAEYLGFLNLQYLFEESVQSEDSWNLSEEGVKGNEVKMVHPRVTLSISLVRVEDGDSKVESQPVSPWHRFGPRENAEVLLQENVKDAARKLAEWVAKQFPLKGKVTAIEESGKTKEAVINIGSEAGAQKKQVYIVLREKAGRPPSEIGKIELTSVGPKSSLAKIKKGKPQVGDDVSLEVK